MANLSEISTIPVVHHKISEKVNVLVDGVYDSAPILIIRDLGSGNYFNKLTKAFEEYSSTSYFAGNYGITLNKLYDTGVYNASLSTLPPDRQALLFYYNNLVFSDAVGGIASSDAIDETTAEYLGTPFYATEDGDYYIEFSLTGGSSDTVFAEVTVNGTDVANTSVQLDPPGTTTSYRFNLASLETSDVVRVKAWASSDPEASSDQPEVDDIKVYRLSYERHVFGGEVNATSVSTCTIYGTLLDVAGNPMQGQKVEVYLNRAGYFTHKAGLVGYAVSALTNESGYWQIPVIVGLDITISVPVIGFTQSGFVPSLASVELTSETLLKYKP